jgi:type IV pilus assembly protein PilO
MERFLDQINKAPNSLKFGVLAALVVLATAANFVFVLQPLQAEGDALVGQLSTLNKQLAEKQEIAQNLTDKTREFNELQGKLEAALTELPEKKDVDELLNQLNDVAKKSGLEIIKVEPGAEAPSGFFARIPVKMMVQGNYHEIALFLQEVASLRRIVNVNNIKFGGGVLKGDKVVLNSDFLATTFRFVDQTKNPGEKKKATQ